MKKHEWYSDTDAKTLQVFEQNRFLHAVAEARERQLHPHADDREIFLWVLAQGLDRETMLRI